MGMGENGKGWGAGIGGKGVMVGGRFGVCE